MTDTQQEVFTATCKCRICFDTFEVEFCFEPTKVEKLDFICEPCFSQMQFEVMEEIQTRKLKEQQERVERELNEENNE